MAYLITPYTIARLLTGVVSIIVTFFVWKRRTSRGGWPLFLLFVMVSEWALANGLKAADEALYQAKKNGRDCTCAAK